MWNNYLTLNEVFEEWESGGGIITALGDNFTLPWADTEIENDILDLEYYGNCSGDKIISPLVKKLTNNDDILENQAILKLAKVIHYKYGKKWDKLWATLNFEYNPIENYSMTETETRTGENAETIGEEQGGIDTTANTGTDTTQKNGTRSNTQGGTDEITETGSTTEENAVFGFNGATASPESTKETTRNNETTTDYGKTETETNQGTDTQTLNLQTQTTYGKTNDITKNGTEEETRTLTRAGNIGVTTSQQMIESERDLWNWDFFKQVFNDIDKILTIPAYGGY